MTPAPQQMEHAALERQLADKDAQVKILTELVTSRKEQLEGREAKGKEKEAMHERDMKELKDMLKQLSNALMNQAFTPLTGSTFSANLRGAA